MRYCIAIIAGIICLPLIAPTQSNGQQPDLPDQVPINYLEQVQRRSLVLQEKIQQHTVRYLKKIEREEQKLLRKLVRHDSTAGRALKNNFNLLLSDSSIANNTDNPTVYLPYKDTLQTSLLFLSQHPQLLQPGEQLSKQLTQSSAGMQALNRQLQQGSRINELLQQRQQLLIEKLEGLGLTREIRRLKQQVYYYNQQLNEYKELLQHPSKLERKVIDLLSAMPLFQDFMRRHSQLAALFRLPGSDPGSFSQASYASLQTRASVNELIQQQLAVGGPNAQQLLQQQIQTAQTALNKIKDKISSGLAGPASDMPDFKPNRQKTKTFKQRLEWGTNLQSQRATNYFPVTTDIGVSLGYKLNDRSVAGIGASYKVGWGQGWNHIAVSNQGAGLRSFVDWKIRKTYWLSGGLEANYRPRLAVNDLPLPAMSLLSTGPRWQQSGLVGLSKKYQAGKRFAGKIQLLWDFLSYRQQPRSQPFVCRVGYDFKK
ncbi:hypothetical protein D3H65_09165 [Paraflavitalea soli]|uniref:Uncharacterized protein n=1 Tax=Paraflavitalea soli TaxID=2315862 RepID=A0A3B7MUI2_9BACT|nr:hypothetical protein [Paraflavitalea soli]AXY74131.1 hypothetical protein D3H65_09165 [Paraflavitalea soli]